MALQYIGGPNFQAGTLASGYTAGGASLVLTSGHGARFPSSGDFWVRVDDEVLQVTARSTDTLTVTGAQDGTIAANHSASADVYWVLGVEGLDQLRADIRTATINAQTGTSYTLLTSDNGGVVTCSNASAITVTVPSGLGAGFNCLIVQLGAGQVTISGSGATINQRQSYTKTAGQYATATLLAHAANTFVMGGDLA